MEQKQDLLVCFAERGFGFLKTLDAQASPDDCPSKQSHLPGARAAIKMFRR